MTTQTQAEQSSKSSIKSFIPILEWLPKYKKSWLSPDTIAALTVWALLVPVLILGGIYSGVFTPTEAGAVVSIADKLDTIVGIFATRRTICSIRVPGSSISFDSG